MKVWHTPNLYWETYSGTIKPDDVLSTGPVYGLVRTAIHLIPFSLMMFPTIYIYHLIIKETDQRTKAQIIRKRCNFLSARFDPTNLQGRLSRLTQKEHGNAHYDPF